MAKTNKTTTTIDDNGDCGVRGVFVGGDPVSEQTDLIDVDWLEWDRKTCFQMLDCVSLYRGKGVCVVLPEKP